MLVKITAATGEAVSVERAKERLRILHDDEDDDLAALIEAATAAVESHTGLTLRETEFELRLGCWPWRSSRHWHSFRGGYPIKIPAAPVRDVSAVTHLDDDAVEQTIAAENYYWERTEAGADLFFVDDYSLPSLADRPAAVRVRFTAGFDDPSESGSGDDPELAFPGQAEMAILFLVGHWHQTRESVQTEQQYVVPDTFKYLADQLRIFR